MPIQYDMPLFRPPSEAGSLILQATLGCSWNRCSFCDMYTSKKFEVRPVQEVVDEIDAAARSYNGINKVFLADGNAMVLSNNRLLPILEAIHSKLPEVRQISSYALPSDINRKSQKELNELQDAGLNLLYIGVESGDDEVLKRVDKGETEQSSISALAASGEAGIKRSVMILNGLGGTLLSKQHAVATARVLNAGKPEFAATLVVSFPLGEQRFRKTWGEGYVPLSQAELFEEVKTMLLACDLKDTEFRSNHASNYLTLKGKLNQDRDSMVAQIDFALAHPNQAGLRQEWQRGL